MGLQAPPLCSLGNSSGESVEEGGPRQQQCLQKGALKASMVPTSTSCFFPCPSPARARLRVSHDCSHHQRQSRSRATPQTPVLPGRPESKDWGLGMKCSRSGLFFDFFCAILFMLCISFGCCAFFIFIPLKKLYIYLVCWPTFILKMFFI